MFPAPIIGPPAHTPSLDKVPPDNGVHPLQPGNVRHPQATKVDRPTRDPSGRSGRIVRHVHLRDGLVPYGGLVISNRAGGEIASAESNFSALTVETKVQYHPRIFACIYMEPTGRIVDHLPRTARQSNSLFATPGITITSSRRSTLMMPCY